MATEETSLNQVIRNAYRSEITAGYALITPAATRNPDQGSEIDTLVFLSFSTDQFLEAIMSNTNFPVCVDLYGGDVISPETLVSEYVAMPITAKAVFLRIREMIERPRPFVDIGGYFGPDRRRRSVAVETAEDERRRKGTPRSEEEAPKDSGETLSESEIDRLVAGGDIADD